MKIKYELEKKEKDRAATRAEVGGKKKGDTSVLKNTRI